MAQAAEIETNALPVRGPAETLPAIRSETAAVLNMIERAARDPAVDIDKLRQLMELRDRTEARQAERDFAAAMTSAQSEMGRIRTDANNPQTRSKYATYAAVDREIRPVYTRHGFSLSFDTEEGAAADHVRVVCYVQAHGHTRRYHIDMPSDGKGAKGGDVMTKTHAAGSAVSYGRRYLAMMIFNLAIGEDDDGNAADDTGETINQAQLAELVALADDVGADKEKFCRYMKAESFAAIRVKDFSRAKQALNSKRKA